MTSMTSNISAKEGLTRRQCLDAYDDLISKCQNDITNMLDTLGWTPEHFMKPRNYVVCPHNSNHKMTKSALDKHGPVCELVTQGYSKDEAEKILQDASYFYENASCVYSVKLDLDTMNSVLWNHHVQNHSVFYGYKKVPLTAEEEQQLMTREDRLGISEYIIKRAKEANRLKELGQDELLVSENLADLIKKGTEERKLDPIEEMAALRDYRRRRQTYRAKNVHITKKSHTEIMREVINNQMEMYSQSLKEEMGEEAEEAEEKTFDRENRDRSRSTRKDDQYKESERYSRSRSRSRGASNRRYYRRSRSHSRHKKRGRNRDSSERSSRDTSQRSAREDMQNTSHKSKDENQSSKDIKSWQSSTKDQSEVYKSKNNSQSVSEDKSNFENQSASEALAKENQSVPDHSLAEESCLKHSQSPSKNSRHSMHEKGKERSRSRSSSHESRSSKDRGRSKHKKKDKHRSRSRSESYERSKKSKHKKHKHKKKGKKSHRSDKEDGELPNGKSEPGSD